MQVHPQEELQPQDQEQDLRPLASMTMPCRFREPSSAASTSEYAAHRGCAALSEQAQMRERSAAESEIPQARQLSTVDWQLSGLRGGQARARRQHRQTSVLRHCERRAASETADSCGNAEPREMGRHCDSGHTKRQQRSVTSQRCCMGAIRMQLSQIRTGPHIIARYGFRLSTLARAIDVVLIAPNERSLQMKFERQEERG